MRARVVCQVPVNYWAPLAARCDVALVFGGIGRLCLCCTGLSVVHGHSRSR